MKQKKSKHMPRVFPSTSSKDWIVDVLTQVKTLTAERKRSEAFELLLPLLRQFPREITVLNTAVEVYDAFGMPWQKTYYLHQAAELDPNLLMPLAYSYARLQLTVLSLLTLRRVRKITRDPQVLEIIRTPLSIAESDIQPVLRTFAINEQNGELGLKFMEEAQIMLHMENYQACIQLNLQASKNLKDFPPPLNNLSLAYFFSGQWKHAIEITRGVLKIHPTNFQAQANLVHFLAWTGGLIEAQSIWKQIRKTIPDDETTLNKLVETAAIMEDDETVYKLLHSLKISDLDQPFRFYLAIAEANLGKSGSRKVFSRLVDEDYHGAREILTALRNGKKGLGYCERFSYKQAADYLPSEFRSLYNQAKEGEDPDQLSKRVKERNARYPQLILAAKKLIYEEDMPEAGCQLLVDIATPESFEILREFGTGKVGDKQTRMHALNQLLESDQVPNGSKATFWDGDKWTDIELRRILISDEDDRPYSLTVKKILDQGLRLYQQGKQTDAEQKFIQALKMEPRAKEALNNLGTFYVQAGQVERGLECFRQAIEIDPLYIMARCNIANLMFSEDRFEEAQEMIHPLYAIEKASSQAMALLSYTRARIAYQKQEFEEAQNQASFALKMNPDMEIAEKLLESAKFAMTMMRFTSEGFFAQRKELQIRAREKLRGKITNPVPSIADVLPIFSREILQSITRKWGPHSGWSTFKKAQLLECLHELMLDPYNNSKIVTNLEEDEKTALKFVLGKGGSIPWEEFSQTYDNDLEESPYWQYHDPTSLMGRLRCRCLLVEATVEGQLVLSIPREFRAELEKLA